MSLYAYPTPNSALIAAHGLQAHFEGGFFAQTVAMSTSENGTVSSGPGAFLSPKSEESDGSGATQIYYLLTPDSWRGRMHMNLHATFHVHHAGRAKYTLIKANDGTPEIRTITMGSDVANGEVTQLYVPGGWWKASEIPADDLKCLEEQGKDKEYIGCLISEIVVPGWNPQQHQFIDLEKLKALWGGEDGWQEYQKYIAAPEGLVYPDKQ